MHEYFRMIKWLAKVILKLIRVQKNLKSICEGSILCPKFDFTFADFFGARIVSLDQNYSLGITFDAKIENFQSELFFESSHCFHDS